MNDEKPGNLCQPDLGICIQFVRQARIDLKPTLLGVEISHIQKAKTLAHIEIKQDIVVLLINSAVKVSDVCYISNIFLKN